MTGRGRPTALLLTTLLLLAGCSRDEGHVIGGGTIEMDEVDVASLIGGRIVRLAVEEGDSVAAGDTITVLDRGEVIAELEERRAQAARAEAQARDIASGPRAAEVRAARAELAAAEAQARLAAQDFARASRLFEQGLTSRAELDRACSTREAAEARRDAMAAQLRLLEQGSRGQQIAAARDAADAARAQASAGVSRASELTLRAPISGTVLLRNLAPGEIALAGQPIVTLGDPDSLWMRVYIAAPEMPRVRLGAPAEVRVLGIARGFRGRVVEIASRAEFTPRVALTEEERANLVFGVKIALEPTGGALKAGLPAEARIVAAVPDRQ